MQRKGIAMDFMERMDIGRAVRKRELERHDLQRGHDGGILSQARRRA
jgi:hypothetical protein